MLDLDVSEKMLINLLKEEFILKLEKETDKMLPWVGGIDLSYKEKTLVKGFQERRFNPH